VDVLLATYGGGLREAREWLRAPLVVVLRLCGMIKRRNEGAGGGARVDAPPEVAAPPSADMIATLDEMWAKRKGAEG